jgi:hypothetical protein
VTADVVRVSPDWLALREPVDHRARATNLLEPVRRRLAGGSPVVIHDLGSGTGSMARWLAPRLAGKQHWIMYDRDRDLLDLAAIAVAEAVGDDADIAVETRERDITRLTAADLAGASLITASALLDMFTAEELERVVAACAGAGCPTLLTISVNGRVELSPAHPLDAHIADAFNAHQRRTLGERRLLGPDAVDAAAAMFAGHGIAVRVSPSPWRLGPDESDLAAEWFVGWLAAACEQRPDLSDPAVAYARDRLADAAAGRLQVVVHHSDLLANCE